MTSQIDSAVFGSGVPLANDDGVVLDGMCVIGRLVEVRAINRKDGSGAVAGMANAVIEHSRGRTTVALQDSLRTIMGTVELAAWGKLAQALPGSDWIIQVGPMTSNGYTNYVAVDARQF